MDSHVWNNSVSFRRRYSRGIRDFNWNSCQLPNGYIAMKSILRDYGLLTIIALAVYFFYSAIVRPIAAEIDVLVAAGQSELMRNGWVIIRDWEQQICITLFLWALWLVFLKFQELDQTVDYFEQNLLDIDKGAQQAAEEAVTDLEASIQRRNHVDYLRSARALLRRFLVTKNVHAAGDMIEAECSAWAMKLDSANATIRYLIWAVPSIGFIGTVRGIGQALSEADKALAGDISGMTASLGVAFNSTLVALVISIVMTLLLYGLQRAQEDQVTRMNEALHRHVVDPLSHAQLTSADAEN